MFLLAVLLLSACKKDTPLKEEIILVPSPADSSSPFLKYSIAKGAHYCDQTSIKPFAGKHLSLKVRFDSSAIYSNRNPENQADINKLVGFTEGMDNHVNSARFGWGWSNSALRLYAYSYAAGVRSSREISIVQIGLPVSLSLSIDGNQYIFKVNDSLVTLPRALITDSVSGYWQYPYFGGDETAPHTIAIYLQYL